MNLLSDGGDAVDPVVSTIGPVPLGWCHSLGLCSPAVIESFKIL